MNRPEWVIFSLGGVFGALAVIARLEHQMWYRPQFRPAVERGPGSPEA